MQKILPDDLKIVCQALSVLLRSALHYKKWKFQAYLRLNKCHVKILDHLTSGWHIGATPRRFLS